MHTYVLRKWLMLRINVSYMIFLFPLFCSLLIRSSSTTSDNAGRVNKGKKNETIHKHRVQTENHNKHKWDAALYM